ncbi:MAG: hypothetical protein ACYC3L_02035 [Gemmatimonadaceae bacterium]
MASSKLDGAGAQKLKTLEDALITIQSLHGMVEKMAMEVTNKRPIGVMPMQLKRMAAPLVGQLKGQFGPIADLVSSMILVAGRGGGDTMKVRAYREHIGQLRQMIDFAEKKVKRDHSVAIDIAPE